MTKAASNSIVCSMSSRCAVSTTECMQRNGSETKALGMPSREWKILSVSVPVKRLLASCWIGMSLPFATSSNCLTTNG